jgi:hypothetical protein
MMRASGDAGGPAPAAAAPVGGGPAHLPSLADFEYDAVLNDLRHWVEALLIRFALDVGTIPPCWAQHNAMVETLAALRDHERGCYVGSPRPTAGLEWIRAVRETVTYLKELTALTQCTAHAHRDGSAASI